MFNEFGKKKASKKTNSKLPLMFVIGGALGAIGTYFFATEKGIASRKKIAENASDLSSNVSDKVIYLKDKFAQISAGKPSGTDKENVAAHVGRQDSATTAPNHDEKEVPTKAQSMVNHLKHTKSSNHTEPS